MDKRISLPQIHLTVFWKCPAMLVKEIILPKSESVGYLTSFLLWLFRERPLCRPRVEPSPREIGVSEHRYESRTYIHTVTAVLNTVNCSRRTAIWYELSKVIRNQTHLFSNDYFTTIVFNTVGNKWFCIRSSCCQGYEMRKMPALWSWKNGNNCL